MNPVFFHLDLDAFFASVEQLDEPSLRGLPVIVGAAPGSRGVVSTCSYEARAFGVRSAMPISEAYRRCPGGVFLRPRMSRYAELSERVMDILSRYSPDLRRVSIDEAFLDMGGTERLWGHPGEAARRIKREVFQETGLRVSIGVAPNPYVAKIASGLSKPDGLMVIEAGEEAAFMLDLPLSKLWGAGTKTQEHLAAAGIRSVKDLAERGEAELRQRFGQAGARFLYEAARGRDPGIMSGETESRSISTETTFERDVSDQDIMESVLMEMSDGLGYRLWSQGQASKTITLKLRLFDFTTLTRRITKDRFLSSSIEVHREAMILLGKAWDGKTPVRLIGLGFAELGPPVERQAELFPAEDSKTRLAESAVYRIESRGLGELRRARLLRRKDR